MTVTRTKLSVCATGCLVVFAGLGASCVSLQPTVDANEAAYEQAIRASAIKAPSFRRTLMPIPAGQQTVGVVTLAFNGEGLVVPHGSVRRAKNHSTLHIKSDTHGVLKDNTWVSLPEESHPACVGSHDPLLKLQQLLGMPPQDGDWTMVAFEVDTSRIFRPCVSSPDITTKTCSFTVPAGASVSSTQLFDLDQMWSSYVTGFQSPGYPFTGMGWTWNWDPKAKDPYGISEYVVRKGAHVTNIKTMTPTEFCSLS